MDVEIRGDDSLVSVAEVLLTNDGWELTVSRAEGARAYVTCGTRIQGFPVQVAFDVVPNDWEFNKSTSREHSAVVLFTATTAEEARALRNLAPVTLSRTASTVTRLAMRPGLTWLEHLKRSLRIRGEDSAA